MNTEPLGFENVYATLKALDGKRVRLTFRPGVTKQGIVEVRRDVRLGEKWKPEWRGTVHEWVKFAGTMAGGEIAAARKIEVMRGNRYVSV